MSSQAVPDPVPRSAVTHRLTRRLPATLDATITARKLARRACTDWRLDDLRDTAELIVTEFVGNVVRHAGTPMDVTLTFDGTELLVSVHDQNQQPPRRATPETTLLEHGRGLLVVEALATAWGSRPEADGKVVWASLRRSTEPR